MSQPPPYTPTTSFTDTNFNTEFTNLKTTLDAILANLVLLQRDDDKFKDGIGEPHLFNLSASAEGFLKYESETWSFIPDPAIPAATALAAAETAQAAAEAARDLASTYKNDSEAAKLAAETAQAAAELAAQAVSSSENIQSGSFWHATSTGSGFAYEVVLNPVPSSLVSGLFINMKAHAENTGAATLNVNSLGAKSIKKIDGSDLKSGDIPTNALVTLVYDGTNFQITNLTPSNEELNTITSNLFLAFDEIQENHAGSLLMEKSWSDSFANPNEQGADETNSIGHRHDATNKLYKGASPGISVNSDKDYATESNYIQQEWTNLLPSTGQATVTNGNATVTLVSGDWPTNCEKARISFDSGSTWYDIKTRTDNANIELGSVATESTNTYNYIIRFSEFQAGAVSLNEETIFTTVDSNTKLLLHMDGTDGSTTFTDSGATGHSVTANGNAQIDTAQSKFGGASALFDGAGDYLTIPDHSDWDFFSSASKSFTLDCWFRLSTTSGYNTFCAIGTATSYHWGVYIGPTSVNFQRYDAAVSPGYNNRSWAHGGLSVNTWYHLALIKGWGGDASKIAVTLNGVEIGTTITGDTYYIPSGVSGNLTVGRWAYNYTGYNFQGHIEELRLSSTARWTSNFTPPIMAYPVEIVNSPTSEYISICDTETQKTDTFNWVDINSSSVSETLNSQNSYYWLSFDPASNFGDGTEIKIFNPTGNVWRKIARKISGVWQYNNDSSNTVAEDWQPSTVDEMLHAISQAISTQAANRMTGSNLTAITDTQWEESGGWSSSINSVVRGITLYSNNSIQTPSTSQYSLNYDSERGEMDLRSKTYDPGFVPNEVYLWTRAEHSDADGPGIFSVTRNGGTEWENVSMVQQGNPLNGDVRILRGTVDINGQTSGQDLRCRYQTTPGKDQFIHSWGLLAKS